MQHNHGAISLAIKCYDLTKPGRRTKDKIDGPRSFPWFVLRSHASTLSLSIVQDERLLMIVLDSTKRRGLRSTAKGLLICSVSLPLSPSLFLMMPPPPPLATHRVWPRQSSKRLYRAPLRTSGRQDSGLIESFHFSPKSLFLFFSNYLRQFYLPLSLAESLSLLTLFSGDEDFALAKEERRRNLGFVVYTR